MKADHGLLAEGGATPAFVVDVAVVFLGYILETVEPVLVLSLTVLTRQRVQMSRHEELEHTLQ